MVNISTPLGTYTGTVMNGKPHGTGKWVAGSGITYDGEWKEGMRHGYGVKTYISGNKYVTFVDQWPLTNSR